MFIYIVVTILQMPIKKYMKIIHENVTSFSTTDIVGCCIQYDYNV